jgi:hypothetical protein
MIERAERSGGEHDVVERAPGLDSFDELASGGDGSEEKIAYGIGHNWIIDLFPRFWVAPLRLRLPGAHDPVPGVPDGFLDLLPRGWLRATMLVAVPAPPKVGLRLIPIPSRVVLRGLEAVTKTRAEAIVIVRSQGIGTAGKVFVPVIILGLPGSLPRGILDRRNTVEGIRFRHGGSLPNKETVVIATGSF